MVEAVVLIFAIIHSVLSKEIICSGEYACQGEAGDTVEVPCGSDNLHQSFTYYNESSKQILKHNTTEHLKLNLTAFDDKIVIVCALINNTEDAPFRYFLSVLYPPMLLRPPVNQIPHINQPYLMQCPFVSNPQSTCMWRVFECFDFNSTIHNVSDYGIFSDKCSLYISEVMVGMRNMCFSCSAMNQLGSNEYFFNNLEFAYCATSRTIIMSPQPDSNSHEFQVFEGGNVTLRCDGFGFAQFTPVIWQSNSTEGNITITTDYGEINHQNLCNKISLLTVANIKEADTGVYTCFFDENEFKQVKIIVLRASELSPSSSHEEYMVGIVLSGSVIILAASIVSALLMVIFRRYRNVTEGIDFMALSEDHDNWECEYDVFISFSEDDKLEAEETIKKPLEMLGYTICWHHNAFIPGLSINENMETFIFQSKYIIALISKSFFKSEFCKNELDIARRKVQKTGENCLIPIMMENWVAVPAELLKITYINIDDKLLLQRLQQILDTPVKMKLELLA